MVIDRRGLALFVTTALATTCNAFSFGVAPGATRRQQSSLKAFASDRGENAAQFDHFTVSDDSSSPSVSTGTFGQESTTIPLSPPPMARPAESSNLARAQSAPPPADMEGEPEPAQPQLSVWERQKAAEVQGGSLRTWSFADQHKIDMIQVHMKTDGRPMNANVELWQGPDNVPQKVAIYCEDGSTRPFRCFLATPYTGNSISIRNTGSLEYPLQAILEGGKVGMNDPETKEKMERVQTAKPKICQGGAVITERFEPGVQSAQIFLQSEGRPLQCRIELIQGPNNVKQVMEVYTEEGTTRPFYAIIQTPGYGTGVIRIVNTSTLEFPFSVTVQPWDVGFADDDYDARPTGGSPFFEISGGAEGRGIGNSNLRSVGSPTDSMGGMFGSFGPSSSSTTSPAPSPAKAKVKRNMIAPKEQPPSLEPEPEPSPIFLQNEEFAVSSSKSSLSQDPILTTVVPAPRRKAAPKASPPPPEPELETEVEAQLEVEADPTPIANDPPPSPPRRKGPVQKRYVPPPSPPPPPKKSMVFLDIDPAYK